MGKKNIEPLPRTTHNGQEVKLARRMTKQGLIIYPGVHLTKDGKLIGLTGSVRRPTKNPNTGGDTYSLKNHNGKQETIHISELMCNTWVELRPQFYYESGRPYFVVDYIDGDNSNIHADNLRWAEYKYLRENRDYRLSNQIYQRECRYLLTDYKGNVIEGYPFIDTLASENGYTYAHVIERLDKVFDEVVAYNDQTKNYEHLDPDGQVMQVIKNKTQARQHAKEYKISMINDREYASFFKDRFRSRQKKENR